MAPLYDRPEVSRTYFFPRPGPPLPATADAAPLPLSLPDGTRLGGYWSRPLPAAPTLLYLHGNGEIIADQLDVWPTWARQAGANIFFLDYPGYATSEGEPCFSACRQAAAAALAWLVEQDAPVILAGRSVGSIFALDAAASAPEPVRGLWLESGVADLTQRLAVRWPVIAAGSGRDIDRRALEAEVARDFDHRAKLARLRCPVLVLHTRDDDLIPCWHGERLAQWAGENLLRLELFPRGDHNTIQWVNGEAYPGLLAQLVGASGS